MRSAVQQIPSQNDPIRRKVRDYIIENMLLGASDEFDESASLLEAGILDSTGAMELVAFLEQDFGVRVADHEIVADNLDSVDRICALIERKQAHGRPEA